MDIRTEQQDLWERVWPLIERLNCEYDFARATFYVWVKKKDIDYSKPLLPSETKCVFQQVYDTQKEVESLLQIIEANAVLLCVSDTEKYMHYSSMGYNVVEQARDSIYLNIGITKEEWQESKMFIQGCINNTSLPASDFFNQLTNESKEALNLIQCNVLKRFLIKLVNKIRCRKPKLFFGLQIVALPVIWLVHLIII